MLKITKIMLLASAGMFVAGGLLTGIATSIIRKDPAKYSKVVKKEYICNADITAIDLDLTSQEVRIVKGDVDNVTVEYYEDENEQYTFSEDDGNLRVTYYSAPKAHIGFTYVDNHEYDVIVTVPSDMDLKYDCRLESGDIEMESISSGSDMELNTSSGDIVLSDVDVKGKLTCEGTSGDIEIKGLGVGGDAETKTTSGDVKLDDINVSGNFIASTFSGDVNGNELNCNTMNASCTSGDINFKDLNTDSVDAETTSGSVYLMLEGKKEDYNITLKVTSGDKNMDDVNNENASRSVRATTTSGDIDIFFAE